MQIFHKYIHAYVCIYIYKIITHILCKHKLLFWMRLIVSQPYFILKVLARYPLQNKSHFQSSYNFVENALGK